MNDEIASEIKRRLPDHGRRVVFVCGLGGAGKTEFCLTYSKAPDLEGTVLHVDWYLKHATMERRRRIAEALASGDEQRLHDEEYPVNWTDLRALANDLRKLKHGDAIQIEQAWDQRTGEKTYSTSLRAAEDAVIWCDGIYLLHPEIADLADVIVLLDASEQAVVARADARDRHRSDAEYLAYKARLKNKYDVPYFERYRSAADIIIDNSDFNQQKIVR